MNILYEFLVAIIAGTISGIISGIIFNYWQKRKEKKLIINNYLKTKKVLEDRILEIKNIYIDKLIKEENYKNFFEYFLEYFDKSFNDLSLLLNENKYYIIDFFKKFDLNKNLLILKSCIHDIKKFYYEENPKGFSYLEERKNQNLDLIWFEFHGKEFKDAFLYFKKNKKNEKQIPESLKEDFSYFFENKKIEEKFIKFYPILYLNLNKGRKLNFVFLSRCNFIFLKLKDFFNGDLLINYLEFSKIYEEIFLINKEEKIINSYLYKKNEKKIYKKN